MFLLPLQIHTSSKKEHFSLFPHMSRQWKLGRVMAKKQPQVVKIPPHMVHNLYFEKYLSIQSMLGKRKEEKREHFTMFGLYIHT